MFFSRSFGNELVTRASVLANSAWLLTSKLTFVFTNKFTSQKKGRRGEGMGNLRGRGAGAKSLRGKLYYSPLQTQQ